jgi:hypothetical protein
MPDVIAKSPRIEPPRPVQLKRTAGTDSPVESVIGRNYRAFRAESQTPNYLDHQLRGTRTVRVTKMRHDGRRSRALGRGEIAPRSRSPYDQNDCSPLRCSFGSLCGVRFVVIPCGLRGRRRVRRRLRCDYSVARCRPKSPWIAASGDVPRDAVPHWTAVLHQSAVDDRDVLGIGRLMRRDHAAMHDAHGLYWQQGVLRHDGGAFLLAELCRFRPVRRERDISTLRFHALVSQWRKLHVEHVRGGQLLRLSRRGRLRRERV